MDITIPRAMIEQRLKRANERYEYQLLKSSMCRADGDIEGASWYDGASYSTKREIDTLEILLEIADDISHGVYSIAQ